MGGTLLLIASASGARQDLKLGRNTGKSSFQLSPPVNVIEDNRKNLMISPDRTSQLDPPDRATHVERTL